MCNVYWASVTSTTILPKGNPKLLWPNVLIACSKNSFKFMTAHNTMKYLDALTELLDRCNQCIHSSINMVPADMNHCNDEVVW